MHDHPPLIGKGQKGQQFQRSSDVVDVDLADRHPGFCILILR
jgi:hypothetical protein